MRSRGRRRARRSATTATACAVIAATLAGCFTTTADFGDDAETFIEEDQELRDALFPDAPTTFVTATCLDPENQDEGTTFACTATDSGDATWEFEIVITGSSEYEVNVARRPPDS